MRPEGALSALALAAGWTGQACFFARFFVQWLASERAGRPVVPRSFWGLSLCGAALAGAYALERGRELFLFGFVVSGAIAARNLRLRAGAGRVDARWGALAALLAVALVLGIELAREPRESGSALWLALGVVGQACWAARFPLQWWLSERRGRSHFPLSFWWLSLAGNGLLLAYAVHLRDAVLVAGLLPGPLLQARNLALARSSTRRVARQGSPSAPGAASAAGASTSGVATSGALPSR